MREDSFFQVQIVAVDMKLTLQAIRVVNQPHVEGRSSITYRSTD